jgi:DNA polymerase-3 subunit alpha
MQTKRTFGSSNGKYRNLTEIADHPFLSVHFTVDASRFQPEDLSTLKALIMKYPGKYEGFLHLQVNGCETVIFLGQDARMDISDELKDEAEQFLGKGTTRFL